METLQCAFNKAMITPFTKVTFIDEADENVLNISNWKILTQGGYTAHDIKYQTTKAFTNRCLMLPMAQHKLGSHQWTDTCAHTISKAFKAAAWQRKHAMECMVWAAKRANYHEGDTKNKRTTQTVMQNAPYKERDCVTEDSVI